MTTLRCFGAAFGLLLACPLIPANAQPVEQTVQEHRDELGEIDRRGDAFVHRASGYVYPAVIGAMPARKTITFGPHDAEVYYTLYGGSNGDAWVSLYVYPARASLAEEKKGVEATIVENYAANVTSRPSPVGAAPTGVVEGWFAATIKGVPVVTGARISQVSGWNVKVRVSIPVSGGKEAMDRAAAALDAIPMNPVGLRPAGNAHPGTTSGIIAVR